MCCVSIAESRHNRFAGGVSDDFIRNYVELTAGLDAVVHGFFIGGMMRGAAELRPLGCAISAPGRSRDQRGETVAEPRRRLGAVAPHACSTARNRGFRLLHMACLADNRRMQQLARKFDAELSFDFGGVVGEVESSRPTPLSLMRELMSDGHGFATAMLDLQSRMLRA